MLRADWVGNIEFFYRGKWIHFSSPQVEKISKESQIEMMLNANLMFKQPLVMLNTSAYDIPSQSCESFGEHGAESGQPILSTGNNKEIIQVVDDAGKKVQQLQHEAASRNSRML